MVHFSFLTSFFYEGLLKPPFFGVEQTYEFLKQLIVGGIFWGVLAIIVSEGMKALIQKRLLVAESFHKKQLISSKVKTLISTLQLLEKHQECLT